MNKMSVSRFFVGFSVAILLVLVVGLMCFYTFSKQEKQDAEIRHSYVVVNQLARVEKLLVDMETGRRGFRCTNDRSFLEPYYKSQPKMAGTVDELKKLVIDNPVQYDKALKLERSVSGIDSFWKTINLATVIAVPEEKVRITRIEKVYMDLVRHDVEEIKSIESKLLTKKEYEGEATIRQARIVLFVGIGLILLVVFFLIRLILSEFKSRVRAEEILNDKLVELELINNETQRANWLLTGIREVNGSLIGHETVRALLQSCLGTIVNYMGMPAGAFHFYNPEKKVLELTGRLALPDGVAEVTRLNEGIIGQAARQKDIVVVNDIPSGYWKIQSALGGGIPNAIICVPIWQKNQLKGVIELACFQDSVAENIKLLTAVSDNIAVAINGVYSNEQLYAILKKVQEQKEELESQQEELRQTNEELTHQAEVLRASEEELKTQEEELRQVNVEMEEKTEAVEMARNALAIKAQELEASSRYKSEFLANMSHELRTPLNSVLILANLLKENKTKNLSDKQTEYARIIHKSGSDLLNLINDILDLSKIEAGKIDIQVDDVKIKEIAYDIEQLFGVVANEKKIRFIIDIASGVPDFIATDKQRLEQVIKNLLSNAFKFTPEGGSITLRFAMQGQLLEVSVTDTGIGIPEEKQKLIFEAFQQADGSTSRRFGGTGLGLSISKELVKRLNGNMTLKSETGKGSTFAVVLPVDMLQPVVASPSPDVPGLLPVFSLDNVKEQTIIADDKKVLLPGEQSILIIEDDANFARIVVDYAHGKGYKTIVAITGDEGLYCAKKFHPSAIILDLGLPVIDGRNVLKILKSDEKLRDIPVHVISSEDRGGISPKDIESYFQKPLNPNDLDSAFYNIGSYIKEHYKNILIVSQGNNDIRQIFEELTTKKNAGIVYDRVRSVPEAVETLTKKLYNCIIIDIGANIDAGIADITELKKQADTGTYIITCLDGDITVNDEKQLKKYSDSVIRKSSQAVSRLLDEVDLFLHRINNVSGVSVPAGITGDLDTGLKGKKVLLADDDMRNVFALTALLEEQGMHVVAAENGKEALSLLSSSEGIDIILMDIMMPEMDGYDTMRAIRNGGKHKKLPIIALTAKAMTGDRDKCIEAGASDYITKPIDSKKLFSLMRVWLT